MTGLGHHPVYQAVKHGFVELRQVALLLAVAREPGLSVRDYAARLGCSKPVVSRACSALLRLDMVTSDKTENDLRLRLLAPTPKGRQVIEDIVGQEALDAVADPRSKAAVNRTDS